MVIINKDELLVRTIEDVDKYIMLKWLNDIKLLEYYEGRDTSITIEHIENHYIKKSSTVKCVFEYEKNAIGYLQYYQIGKNDYRTYGYNKSKINVYGVDIFIGEIKYWNKGIGSKIIFELCSYLFKTINVDSIIVDPREENIRAIHVYEKVGFRKIKLLKNHEMHEGSKRNCWLMEYLREET